MECKPCKIHIEENSAIKKKTADHAKQVRGNAKHAKISTEKGVVGLWETISHCLELLMETGVTHLQ